MPCEIQKDCTILVCAIFTASPKLSKPTAGYEKLRFDQRIWVDTMFLSVRPVIYMEDGAKNFLTTRFSRTNLPLCCGGLYVYTTKVVFFICRPPGFLFVDQGLAYTVRRMKGTVEVFGVCPAKALIKTTGATGVIRTDRGILFCSYQRIRADTERRTSNRQVLTTFSICSQLYHGIKRSFPPLLVFETTPRPA